MDAVADLLVPASQDAPTASDEAGLVAAAAAGDRRAFERLYRRHADRVFGLCWRLCSGDRQKAEQATQDAFVRAWEKLHTFRGESQFGSWLHRLTVNVVLGEHRLLKRWVSFEEALPADAPDESAHHDADGSHTRDLERALARLPRGARTVLWLYDVEGYLHEEIAQQTGITVGTSKSQLHRARKMMKEMLS
jgi:RNA polymerase sigma-70 factor (ECF subfamily)